MKNKKRIRILCECAMMVALSSVLSLLQIEKLPFGGTVTVFSMVPVIMISLLHGPVWGFGSAFVYSAIQLVLGIGDVTYLASINASAGGIVLCILFDFTLAFTALGSAGIISRRFKNRYIGVTLGTLFACVLRYLCHVVSGAVIWYGVSKSFPEYNSDFINNLLNSHSSFGYSAIYNAIYMVPETVITLIAVPVIVRLLAMLLKKSGKSPLADV